MGLSGIQIVTTVILIVVAGCIALYCDYLRHRAQHLRELAVELNVRKEMASAEPAPVAVASAASAAASRNARIRAQYLANSEPISAPPVAAASAVPAAESLPPAGGRHSTAAVAPALASATQIASVRGTARTRRRPVPPPGTPLPRLEDINPRQALSAWLDQRAASRPARQAAVEQNPEPSTPAVEPVIPETVVIAEAVETLAIAAPATEPEAAPDAPQPAKPASDDIRDVLRRALASRSKTKVPQVEPAPEPVPSGVYADEPQAAPSRFDTPDAFLWSALFDAPKKTEPLIPFLRVVSAEVPARRFEVIDGAAPSANSFEVTLPEGMHDYSVLQRAIATGKAFNGLVISVGVSEIDGRSSQNPDVMKSIGYFIKGLLGERDFACRSAEDEFLMICPGLEKAEATRRLNQVTEQLWDYQLRGVSSWSLIFSWGGMDVYQMRLSEAIAMATERMTLTRRSRKTVSMETTRSRARAAV